MENFPPEITLSIAERLDTKSLFKLMMVNKQFHALISKHERSVSLRLMSGFTDPPVGNVFSSEVFLRRPIEEGTFKMAAELEMRHFHIEDVLNSDFFKQALPARFQDLKGERRRTFNGRLKKAMFQCDSIADIAANSPCNPIGEIWYGRLKDSFFEPRDLPLGYRMRDPCTNLGARENQRRHIQTILKEDVAMMYFLLATLSWGFFLEKIELAHADTNFPERQVVFKECVLRHGSWFIWGYLLGGTAWQWMANKMQKIGWAELVSFELGEEDAPASLHSTLAECFNDFYLSDQSAWDGVSESRKNVLSDVVWAIVNDLEYKPRDEPANDAAEEQAAQQNAPAVEDEEEA